MYVFRNIFGYTYVYIAINEKGGHEIEGREYGRVWRVKMGK